MKSCQARWQLHSLFSGCGCWLDGQWYFGCSSAAACFMPPPIEEVLLSAVLGVVVVLAVAPG